MKSLPARITSTFRSNKIGLIVFAVLALLTCGIMVGPFNASFAQPSSQVLGHVGVTPFSTVSPGNVQLSSSLSQTKFVQGSDGVVYLNLTVEPPKRIVLDKPPQATDFIVVLDKSGSMSPANKMPYAKAAIRELLTRLTAEDRFALVSFSNGAELHSGFVSVTNAERPRLTRLVDTIHAGGGTNMGAGIEQARNLFQSSGSERSRKVILLSDGQANQGVSSVEGLSALVKEVTLQSGVVSTIGMGLGFNEIVMSSLADSGMGNYSFLEHLESLGTVLAKDLDDARNMYAAQSEIELHLKKGILLTDAGGYPITYSSGNSRIARISTGQLISSTPKQIVLTLKVPTANVERHEIGALAVNFAHDGKLEQLSLSPHQLALTIVEPSRRDEAIASIDKDTFRKNWVVSNLGKMRFDLNTALRSGDRKAAKSSLIGYQAALREVEAQTGLVLEDGEVKNELRALESQVDEAFAGPAAAQKVKQNRMGKQQHIKAIGELKKP